MSSNTEKAVILLQEALELLSGVKGSAKKPRAESKRGGNKGLIKLDLQRKMVLAEMIKEWSKLSEARRSEKTTETHTTKSGKEVTKDVYVHPQPTYKDAISECKRRKDADQALPDVSDEDIESAWQAQQDKRSSSAEEEVAPAPVTDSEADVPKKSLASKKKAEEATVVAEASSKAKKPSKK